MKLFLVGCILCVAAANCFAVDREAFTFTRYDLDVRLEPEQQRLGVRGKIMLRNDSTSPQKNAVLQISSSLSWRSIHAGGGPLQFVTHPYESDIDHTGDLAEAVVALPREIPPKAEIELEIGYEGVVPLDATRLTRIGVPKEAAVHSDWDQINSSFTAVRGIGHVVWYPVAMEAASLSEDNDLFERIGRWNARQEQSEMKVTIRYDETRAEQPPTLFCNGKWITLYEQINRAQLVIADCLFRPLGLSEPLLLMGNYATLNRQAVNIHYSPGHEAAAEKYALAGDLAAPFVSGWFGGPRAKVEVLELPDPLSAPFESETTLLTPLVSNDSRSAQTVLIHSLSHAAFPSARPWILEGVAQFAQALYSENRDGRRSALDFLGSYISQVQQAERNSIQATSVSPNPSAGPRTRLPDGQPLISASDPVLYRAKAALVWWMLRDLAGGDALKKTFAAYHPEQDHDPSYMPRLIQAQTKRDLTWFFDDWVYHDRGLPDFRVASVYPSKIPQGYLVTISVENLGNAGAEVPVTLKYEGSDMTQRLEVRGKSTASVRFNVSGAPQQVIVNDGSVPESDLSNNTFDITPNSLNN